MIKRSFISTVLINTWPYIGACIALIFLGNWADNKLDKLKTDYEATEAERASRTYKVYCLSQSGQVLFDDTVGYAMNSDSGVYIKPNYHDEEYSTIIKGDCRIDEIKNK